MVAAPSRRQAFFATFSRKAIEVVKGMPNPPRIMLTGGFVSIDRRPMWLTVTVPNISASQSSTSLMAETLRAHHTDIIGVGRASIADPLLPRRLFHAPASDATSSNATAAHHKVKLENGHPSQRKLLAPDPPAPWWTPPDILANASVGTAQWTALLHRRATLGTSILNMPISSPGSTERMREDWLMPLVDASQHEGALRSVAELVVRAEMIDQVVWVIESFMILGFGLGVSLVLKQLGNYYV
jgi:hypothetical protein